MKEKIPHCPHCKTAVYVVLDKKSTRIGTALGGIAGAGVNYTGTLGKAAKTTAKALFSTSAFIKQTTSTISAPALSCIPSSTTILAITGVLMTLLTGFLAGATTGSAVGEHIDSKMRMQFRCNNCGRKICG